MGTIKKIDVLWRLDMVSLLEERVIHTKLTKTGYRIAEYLLENESRLCFMTATAVASEIGVSDASVIRVTRALGFDGFSDMQRRLREKATDMLSSSTIEDISPLERLKNRHPLQSDACNVENLAQQWFTTAVGSLRGVYENNDLSKFEEAADMIIASRQKLICGFRASSNIAGVFKLMLSLIMPNVHDSLTADSSAVDKMMNLTEEDCVVLFTFPRYFKMSKGVAEMARDKGAKLIIFTDRASSPMANGADIVIAAGSQSMNIFSSNMAAQFAAELMITIISHKLGIEKMTYLEWKEKYNIKYGVFDKNRD